MKQADRLDIIAEWMKGELEKADLNDLETIRALRRIIQPVADALGHDAPGPTQPVIVLTVVHDNDRDGYWGTCETCGIISIVCDTADAVLDSVGLHMARIHPSFSLALAHEDVVP